MANNKTIRKETEVERIINALETAISQRKLRPGQRVVESKIAELLNANRNHVQVAIQRLATAKIITVEHHKGAFIAKPSAKEARDVFTARRTVEIGIVSLITPDKLSQYAEDITQHLENEKKIIVEGERQNIFKCLTDFHSLLAKVSENEVLEEILDNLLIRSSIIEVLYSRNTIPVCASNEHKKIIEALEHGENNEAEELLMEHLNGVEAQLLIGFVDEPELNLEEALSGL